MAKGNQVKQKPAARKRPINYRLYISYICHKLCIEFKKRMINHMVQTAWTSEKIETLKNELKKYKDQIYSDDLAKLKDDLLKNRLLSVIKYLIIKF